LVDVPASLARLVSEEAPERRIRVVDGRAIRSVKETFDAVLVWREDRIGSRAVLDHAVKRLDPGGALWVVTAMKKVRGPKTPAIHRLELADLEKGFSAKALGHDRDVRVSSWHVGHRFVRRET
jgi:hypothetical protein